MRSASLSRQFLKIVGTSTLALVIKNGGSV
jgi:hypothetical protein